MSYFRRVVCCVVLAGAMLFVGVAAVPASVRSVPAPVVASTSNAGELLVSWGPVSGASYYTVGYAYYDEVSAVVGAGREWLDAFHYVTVPSTYTSHTLSGLKACEDYYVIIGSQSSRFGGSAPTWSDWAGPVATAGQHGAGFCPITGLPLPEGGYLEVGGTASWSDASFTLVGASRVSSVELGGVEYYPYDGDVFLELCGAWYNGTGDEMYVSGPGYGTAVSTDRGIAFANVHDGADWFDVSPVANGATADACEIWSVPSDAETAVYALWDGSVVDSVLYRIALASS